MEQPHRHHLVGLDLPATDVSTGLSASAALGEWFSTNADSGSLVEYLKTFDVTTGVMQTKEGLERVAREFVQDLGEAVDLGGVHGLHRVVDHHETEGAVGRGGAREEQGQGERVQFALAHDPEGGGVLALDGDVHDERTDGGPGS